jgi:nucleoside-diphosphate-sugar epimerase
MTRLLVTGATGFLGGPVVRAACEHFEVHAAGRAPRTPLPPGTHFHPGDLLAPRAAAALVEAVRPTHLIHLAWVVTPGAVWASPENERWVDASKRLLLAFARCGGRRAVLAGSCAEYDWRTGGLCHELETPARPHTVYGRAKLGLCRWAGEFGRARGVAVAWARLFFLYGPGEHPARVVPSVARALLADEPAPCTAGTQQRDFLHCDDAAGALIELARGGLTGPVNVGSGEAVSVRTVVERVAECCGRPELVRFGARPMGEGEPERLVADVGRLRDELGWRPRVELSEGLRRAVEWWRAERGRVN